MRSRVLPITFVAVLAVLVGVGIYFSRQQGSQPTPSQPIGLTSPDSVISPEASPAVSPEPAATMASPKATNPNPDLTTETNGLSKATVVLTTTPGVIKFKFFSKDAPNTVQRMVELINQGFYNGLTFHRVVPAFVVQGGDPLGNGMGGSGKKLKAEFNDRRHIEGTLAMARAQDPDSADSQFYISLGTHPHLDRNYTVFGQVIEGMDVAKRIQVGDKIITAIIE